MGRVPSATPTIGEIDRLKIAYQLTHAEAEEVAQAIIDSTGSAPPDTEWNRAHLAGIEEARAELDEATAEMERASAAVRRLKAELAHLEQQVSRKGEREFAADVLARRQESASNGVAG